jgi:hypothetical protein
MLRTAWVLSVFVTTMLSMSARAVELSHADKVWNSLVRGNPELGKASEAFVRAYVARIEPSIGELNNFISVMDKSSISACNLLCEVHAAAAFYRPTRPSPFDLVRYVFTATCYGIVPDPLFRMKALADLEYVLNRDDLIARVKFSTYEAWIVRTVLGDAVKFVDAEFPKKTQYRRIRDLWRNAYRSSPNHTNYPPEFVEGQLAASRKACEPASPMRP